MSDKKCSVDGCQKKHAAKGYCGMHYARVQRLGTTQNTERLVGASLEERLWFRSIRDGECWVSQRALSRRVRDGENGYPGIRIGEQMVPVHLASYRLFKGTIPEGYQVHHECDNKRCWNPGHLTALTATEHKRRHYKTECINGHAFTPENTRERVDSNGWVKRTCRTCVRDSTRARRSRAKLA